VAGVPVAVTVAYLTYSRAAVLSVALAVVLVVALSRHRWTAFVHGAVAACGSALLIVTVRSAPGLADGTGVTGVAGAAMIVSVAAVSVACMAAAYGLRGVPLDAFRAGRRATRRALAGVVLVVVLLGATMGPAIASDAWHSFRSPATVDTGDPTARLSGLGGPRHELYDVALRAFRAHPLGGVGAGTFELVWNRERPIVLSVRDAHSLYLEALAEVGIVGAALVVGAIVALVAAVLRARRAARSPEVVALTVGAAAAAIVWALDAGVDWMWESTAVTVGALTVATVAAGALARQARRPRVRLRTAATVAGLAALALQAPLLVASSRLADSQKAFARGDLQTALDAATTASQAEPWASTPLLQRAQVLESSGQLASADRAAVAATRRDGEDWRTWIVLARIDAERGQLRPAVRAAERARRLNPRSPLFAPPRRARTG
jgi:O-antigen ligase